EQGRARRQRQLVAAEDGGGRGLVGGGEHRLRLERLVSEGLLDHLGVGARRGLVEQLRQRRRGLGPPVAPLPPRLDEFLGQRQGRRLRRRGRRLALQIEMRLVLDRDQGGLVRQRPVFQATLDGGGEGGLQWPVHLLGDLGDWMRRGLRR